MTIKFDHSGGVYELFTARGEWRGAFDTYELAIAAKRKLNRRAAAKLAALGTN
jgi:hypothetical protein